MVWKSTAMWFYPHLKEAMNVAMIAACSTGKKKKKEQRKKKKNKIKKRTKKKEKKKITLRSMWGKSLIFVWLILDFSRGAILKIGM